MLDKNVTNSSLLLSSINTKSKSNINLDVLERLPDTSASKLFLQPKTNQTCTKVTPLNSTVISTAADDWGNMTATYKAKNVLAKVLEK